MKIASFFAGAGGLDLGFEQAGFDIVYANEFDKGIWATYRRNHPGTFLDTRSVTEVLPEEVSAHGKIDGMIGGPPCQSWSLGGSMRGLDDRRGRLFYDYVRLVSALKPKFFLAENVAGIVSARFASTFEGIKDAFRKVGYEIHAKLFNTVNYEVPEDRLRVILVGIAEESSDGEFAFPDAVTGDGEGLLSNGVLPIRTLRDAIGDLPPATPALPHQRHNPSLAVMNHEYMTGGFSPIYMARNRRRTWDEPSFTIQAQGRQAPIHPGCPPMERIDQEHWRFAPPEERYRRLSVRECARIQTFPDDFEFIYDNVQYGYKMIGNAVPVRFAYHLATTIGKYFGEA